MEDNTRRQLASHLKGHWNGELVNSLEDILKIITKLKLGIRCSGGTDDDLRRIFSEEGLNMRIADLIMSSHQTSLESYKVVIDYRQTLLEMAENGNYSWNLIEQELSEKFSSIKGVGQQEVELFLVDFNKTITAKEALEILNQIDLEPARIEHLLAFGASYSWFEAQFIIVCLGSYYICDGGNRCHPHLSSILDGQRMLGSTNCVRIYGYEKCKFLALKKAEN